MLMPSASIAEAIVLAVYMPPHAPGPGHDEVDDSTRPTERERGSRV